MKPIYLLLLTIAAFCVYAFLLNYQANHLFPNPAVSVPEPESTIKIDDAIDATDVKKLRYASTHICITPNSWVCWDSEPEVTIQ